MYRDLIASNDNIRTAIVRATTMLGYGPTDIVQDADYYNYKLSRQNVSTYLNHGKGLNQEQVMWLCLRYGIQVKLTVYVEEINKTTLRMRIINFMRNAGIIHNTNKSTASIKSQGPK